MICEQCGGSGQAGPSFEDQFDCTKCNGSGMDILQIVQDLRWSMSFVRDVPYIEQKENRDRIYGYLNKME